MAACRGARLYMGYRCCYDLYIKDSTANRSVVSRPGGHLLMVIGGGEKMGIRDISGEMAAPKNETNKRE